MDERHNFTIIYNLSSTADYQLGNLSTSTTAFLPVTKDKLFFDCFMIVDNIVKVSTVIRSIIAVFYIILMVINTFVNSLSIYVNITTDHWKNKSMRMILYISAIDILHGIINCTPVVPILFPNQLDCQKRMLLMLFPILFTNLSLFIVMFVALDRFLHVMLLGRYKDVVTSAKFNLLLAFYLVVAVGQVFGKQVSFKYPDSVFYLLFITGTISIYIASIVKLKIYDKASRTVSSNTRNLNTLSTAFLVIITVTYTPFLVYMAVAPMIREMIGDGNAILIHHILILVSGLNSSLNVCAYLRLNVKARRKVSSIIQKLLISNVVESTV